METKYYVGRSADNMTDVSATFQGVHILKIDGIDVRGEAVNVYLEQWMDGSTDFIIAGESGNIVRKNPDIKVTFIVGERYATTPNFNLQRAYDTFIDFMTSKDVYLKTEYVDKIVHAVCTEATEITTNKMKRKGDNSYKLGSITLAQIDAPTDAL